ncbi:amidase [Actinomycetospora chlora]|uniref:Amidase n=1 Tax=Actinomycetospora chlora TaxID=663608 RepID=A0ABP9ALB9_9PSEU
MSGAAFDRLLDPPPPAGAGPHADLLSHTLTELAGEIRAGRLGSRELTTACLERIDALDGRDGLNTVLLARGEAVLDEAAQRDEQQAAGAELGPLHGIPVGIKDAFATAGTRTTGGTAVLRDWVPDRDATAVARLTRAGALVLAKLNLHEAGFGVSSNNPHHGPVRNPYDPSRIAGGSSGGSGAAVAAHLCPAALGTDTGASVRHPAAMCGVVGVKPTLGRVGRGGLLGLSWSYDVAGPITRDVADAALMVRVLSSGPDDRDPAAVASPRGELPDLTGATRSVRGRRIGVPTGYFAEDNDPEIDRVLAAARDRLADAGAELVEVSVARADEAVATGFLTVLPEAVVLTEALLQEAGVPGGLASVLHQLGDDVRGALGSQVGPSAEPVPGHVYARAVHETVPAIRRGFLDALDGVDALLTPIAPAAAPPIVDGPSMTHNGRTVDLFETNIRYLFPVSVAGLPAVSVPGGVTADGLPVGLQLVGAPWREDLLLDLALAWQQLTTTA